MTNSDTILEAHDINSIEDLLRNLETILTPQSRGLCLSIFIEAGRTHEEALAARIRFKTEVLNAQRLIETHGDPDQSQALLDPALRLIEDRPFWEHQREGLSYLAASNSVRVLKCAKRFPTLTRLGGDLHLLPLLEAAAMARRFHLLGLSEDKIFLARVSDLGEELLPGVPGSFAEALHSVGFTKERLAEKEFSNKNARANEHSGQALRVIDANLTKAISDTSSTLLLAGIDFVMDSFAALTTWPDLADSRLSGDPGRLLKGNEWGEAARKAMRPQFRTSETQDAQKAVAALASDDVHTLTGIPAIVSAASNANLRSLTLSRGLRFEGSLPPHSVPTTTSNLPPHQRFDLIDFVARRCLADGGELAFVSPEDLPEEITLVAQTRWTPTNA